MEKKFVINEDKKNIRCGVKGCNNNAVTYFIPMLKDSPICEKHNHFFNNNECLYITDENGYNGKIKNLL